MVCATFSVGFSFVIFNFALTSLLFIEGLPLNAIIGGFGNIFFSVLLFCISFKCFFMFSLFVSSQN